MNHRRWHAIKRVLKLNDNKTAPKRGETGYNPAYKFDLLYECMVHNVNYLTKVADDDQCVDESTYGTAAYGEAYSGLVGRLIGKPFNKGGQITIMMDVHRFRPRAYVHRHKLHVRPEGYTREGPNEVRMLIEQVNMLIKSEANIDGIFRNAPHMTLDNYFVDKKIRNEIGKQGYASTSTCQRGLLPGDDIPSKYWHKNKTDSSIRTKVARYLHPVVGEYYTLSSTLFLIITKTNILQVSNECQQMKKQEISHMKLYTLLFKVHHRAILLA